MNKNDLTISGNSTTVNIKMSDEELKKVCVTPDDQRDKKDIILEKNQMKEEIYRLRKIRNHSIKTASFVLGISLIIVSTIQFQYLNTHTNEKRTFNKYFKSYKQDRTVVAGVEAFYAGDYNKSLKLLVDSDTTIVINKYWLQSLSLIEEERYLDALELLKKVDTEESEYLTALLLLRTKQHEKAEFAFMKILRQKGLFAVPAKQIVSDHYPRYRSRID